ncbi:MAG: acetyl-CoA carboxylase, biotin carboxyl carrier protein [Bacteroidetes bacterium]|jgi:acetyl-CoA carboxylase biotin carboxyl carrier protein|nr:acetyl-CoA carboxylase, biotin carboxyl carrier protein [Bacteroidota bacterium]MDF2453396.1 acetyl-CoA carboxylase, biotin carboxyl carrier protein [Bacteroidota bacterium]
MKLTEIQDLIKFVSKSGVNEVELETKEIKIVIKTGKQAAPMMYQAAPTQITTAPAQVMAAPVANPNPVSDTNTTATTTPASNDSKYLTIKSPMIGTFYRSAGPDKAPFVNVGDEIAVGKPVCIIEAMKLFNEIESEVKGKIVKVLVDDATPVEYDQPLFLVDPS